MTNLLEQLKQPVIRSVKTKLDVANSKGEATEQEFTFFYKSRTTKQIKESQDKITYFSEILAERLTKIVCPDGTELEPSLDLLDNWDVRNIRKIEKAIADDADPK